MLIRERPFTAAFAAVTLVFEPAPVEIGDDRSGGCKTHRFAASRTERWFGNETRNVLHNCSHPLVAPVLRPIASRSYS